MSYQDSSSIPYQMDDYDDYETIGGIEIGELLDIGNSEPAVTAGGSTCVGGTGAIAGLDDPTGNASGKASRQKKSIVHTEMEIVVMPDGNKKRKCKWCGSMYNIDSKYHSTSSAKKHLQVCVKGKLSLGVGEKIPTQSTLSINDDRSPNLSTWKYNHGKVRELAAHMILGHECPFSMMEGVIFNKFLREIYPWYVRITRHTVKKDCEIFYENETAKLKKAMSYVDRISLTTDLWWSGEQKIGYMTVTCHYIDAKWHLNKRVIAFTNVPPPHSGEVIARELIRVIDSWHIRDKVVSISVDNASANDNCIARLKSDFTYRLNLPLDGQLFHVRCCAHILNLLVQDGLDIIKPVIDKVRNGVKYLLNSEARCKAFKSIISELRLEGRMQVLDTKTRWNSTWLMLSTACLYRNVWPRYAEENAAFTHYLPDPQQWDTILSICNFLKVFADVTEIISGTAYPTVNLFLAELYRVKVLLDKESESPTNTELGILAVEMKLKYDKYWSQSNVLISIGAVLDPRYKMIFITWVYPFLYPNGDDAKMYKTDLENKLLSLFKLYEQSYVQAAQGPSETTQEYDDDSTSGLGKRSFEEFLDTVDGINHTTSDLDHYLKEPPLKCAKGIKFDVLTWWMANEAKYPVLSKLAKDILPIPITTVASESTFSAGKRIIDPKRASMNTKTVEMLLCGGDWVKEMYGLKKGRGQNILEQPPDDPLQYHFGEGNEAHSAASIS